MIYNLEAVEFPTPKSPTSLTPPAHRRNLDITSAASIPLSRTIDDFKNPEPILRPVKKYVIVKFDQSHEVVIL